MVKYGYVVVCFNYFGEYFLYLKLCCISINDVICYGILDDYVFWEGDIVNIDLMMIVDGWYGD